MSKWILGLPKDKGLYWYDPGFRLGAVEDRHASLLIRSKDYYILGHYGGFPIQHPEAKVYQNVKHRLIERPEDWVNQSTITKSKSIAWIKTPKDELGLALITAITSYGINSTIVWENNPNNRIHVGAMIEPDDEYSFSPIEAPLLK